MLEELEDVSSGELMKTIEKLDRFGVRFAGTREEQACADWIESRFRALKLVNVGQQKFPCLSFEYDRCFVEVEGPEGWSKMPSEPAAHSPTLEEARLEADVVFVEKIPDKIGTCRRLVQGRVVLIYVSELFQFPAFRRVMESGPAALLVVDDRFPNDWTVAVGFPRYWIDFLKCPVVNIPYMSAWEMVRRGTKRVRLDLSTSVTPSTSQNVIGEVKGWCKPEEVIVVSGHHDTVINSSGTDDNGTGVASVLELARIFSGKPSRRTIRFVSYGTEEQLSEGARYYMLEAEDLERIQFVLNIDSVGAWMGNTCIFYSGPGQLKGTLSRILPAVGSRFHLVREVSPFSDHFPLNYAGIPAVWYYRKTFASARHYHHSALEEPGLISPGVLASTVRHQVSLLKEVADSELMPFPRSVPLNQRSQLKRLARDWCGLENLQRPGSR